jgi:hypothetical protein
MRRQRRLVASIVVVLSAVILALILVRLPAVDATTLLTGPSRPLVLTSLVGDVATCCLIFARELQRRHAFRMYGEIAVT